MAIRASEWRRPEARIDARWNDGDILEVVMRGFMTGDAVRTMHEAIRARLAERPARGVFFDANGIDGFSPDVRGPGVEMLAYLRELGLPRAVAVSNNAAVRMMALAIAFTARLPLDFVSTHDEARQRLAARQP